MSVIVNVSQFPTGEILHAVNNHDNNINIETYRIQSTYPSSICIFVQYIFISLLYFITSLHNLQRLQQREPVDLCSYSHGAFILPLCCLSVFPISYFPFTCDWAVQPEREQERLCNRHIEALSDNKIKIR